MAAGTWAKSKNPHPAHEKGDRFADRLKKAVANKGKPAGDKLGRSVQRLADESTERANQRDVAKDHAIAAHDNMHAAAVTKQVAEENPHLAKDYLARSKNYEKRAAEHISHAIGGGWDESKHPRDDSGKFA